MLTKNKKYNCLNEKSHTRFSRMALHIKKRTNMVLFLNYESAKEFEELSLSKFDCVGVLLLLEE